MVEALFNAVIVKPIEIDESTYGTIVVPDMGKEKNLQGEVISVGSGSYSAMGTFMPTTVKVGDEVILPQMGPTKMDYEGNEYYVVEERQILAIIKK
jgi:chaperonin GroES|tara:strand:- start:82 stop:369 length:288 start_codon:yes stop_codon:yes gene_type:complete